MFSSIFFGKKYTFLYRKRRERFAAEFDIIYTCAGQAISINARSTISDVEIVPGLIDRGDVRGRKHAILSVKTEIHMKKRKRNYNRIMFIRPA